jgi:hypothetical protein
VVQAPDAPVLYKCFPPVWLPYLAYHSGDLLSVDRSSPDELGTVGAGRGEVCSHMYSSALCEVVMSGGRSRQHYCAFNVLSSLHRRRLQILLAQSAYSARAIKFPHGVAFRRYTRGSEG